MSEALREELNTALENLYDAACRTEAYADMLRDQVHRLKSDVRSEQDRLANDPTPIANDAHADNARELDAMHFEIGRLCETVTNMRIDLQ
ncbi:hypothetical protein ACFZAD_24670 [Streptomyces iakyrus]|uniref:hypothetical protein n=1 Tax=Streptomyces iakyrus TaxID=68219 RepID=UPI0036E2D711